MLKTISNSAVLSLLLILLVVTVIMVAIIIVLPKIVTKGVDVAKSITTAQNALNTSNAIIKVADTLIPNNPGIDILKVIEAYAQKGVGAAEQLYTASKLEIEQRNAKANEIVSSALKVLNVEVTPSIQTVIDGAIEAEVRVLPKVVLTDAQKQAEKVALQTANAQLIAQNAQLTQSLTQIKSAIINIQ